VRERPCPADAAARRAERPTHVTGTTRPHGRAASLADSYRCGRPPDPAGRGAQALRVAAAAGDKPGVNAEIAVLGWLADRVGGHLRAADQAELEGRLGGLASAPTPPTPPPASPPGFDPPTRHWARRNPTPAATRGEVVRLLAEVGAPVRALVRSPEKAASIQRLDVETALGDFEQPDTRTRPWLAATHVFCRRRPAPTSPSRNATRSMRPSGSGLGGDSRGLRSSNSVSASQLVLLRPHIKAGE
jgi:hypothetical protein